MSNEAHWAQVLDRRPPLSAAPTHRVLKDSRTLIVVCRLVRAIVVLVVSAVIFSVDVFVVSASIQARLAFDDFFHG